MEVLSPEKKEKKVKLGQRERSSARPRSARFFRGECVLPHPYFYFLEDSTSILFWKY